MSFSTNQGLLNYIKNPRAEDGTQGWATYLNTAQALPVSGTGGSPSVTWTRSTTTPLGEAASFLFTKTAVNSQGQGASFDFTIRKADQAKIISISFDYLPFSGTYADGDLTCYIYDVTNAQVIQPAGFTIQNVLIPNKQVATFQAASNSTSYRLIIHCASVSALAYSVQFDNFLLSPQLVNKGPSVSDPASWVPAFVGFGTSPTIAAPMDVNWFRVGAFMFGSAKVTIGTSPAATQAQLPLPNGNVIDSAAAPNIKVCGAFQNNRSTASTQKRGVVLCTGGNAFLNFSLDDYTSATSALTAQTGSAIFTAGDVVTINFSAPIAGWSSNSAQSSDGDGRSIYWSGQTNATTALTTTPTTINFTTVIDKTGQYSAGTFKVIAPGPHRCKAHVPLNPVTTGNAFLAVYKNGVQLPCVDYVSTSTGAIVMGMTVDYLDDFIVGDLITFKVWNSVGGQTLLGSTVGAYATASVERGFGSTQITAADPIRLSARNTAGTSIGTTATLVPFATKIEDTMGAWTGSQYNVSAPCSLRVNAKILTAAVTLGAQQGILLLLYKNGAFYSELSRVIGNGNANVFGVNGSDRVPCLAGDYLQIYATSAVATTLDTTTGNNHLEIERAG